MLKLNGKKIRIDQDLTIGEGVDAVTIPAAHLLDPDTLVQYGITYEPDPVRADDRYYWNGDISTPKGIEDVKKLKLADIASSRFALETGGIELPGGIKIKTDRESQAQLSSAYSSLKDGLIPNTPWKTATGLSVLVTLDELRPIATAVAYHVRACFQAEIDKANELSGINDFEQVVSFDTKVELK